MFIKMSGAYLFQTFASPARRKVSCRRTIDGSNHTRVYSGSDRSQNLSLLYQSWSSIVLDHIRLVLMTMTAAWPQPLKLALVVERADPCIGVEERGSDGGKGRHGGRVRRATQ